MLRAVGSVLVGLGKVVAMFAAQSPGIYFRKKRALTVFESELRAQGLDDLAVRRFTQSYGRMGKLRPWLSLER